MGVAHVLAIGLIAASSTGCVFLDVLLGNDPFDPGATFAPFPVETAPPATYTTGRATIVLTGTGVENAGQTIVLDELALATTEPDFGTNVVWENEDGWYIGFTGFSGFGSEVSVYLSINHVADHEHFVLADPSRCLTTTTQQDAEGLVGKATCRGARWADFFTQYSVSGFPQPIPDLPPFDAEVTFEAH